MSFCEQNYKGSFGFEFSDIKKDMIVGHNGKRKI